jgi:hypothetical protein
MKINYMNKISKQLIYDTLCVYNRLDADSITALNKIVNDIIKIINTYKYFDIKYEELEFKLISSKSVDMSNVFINTIDVSTTIRNKMNKLNTYILRFRNNDIYIKIYYNDKEDITTNVFKIMRRLTLLLSLYYNKNRKLVKFTYIFYFYNNVRISHKNKSGDDYLKELHNSEMRNFNTASGLTDSSKMEIIVSRTEDCLGLLTHEILHACDLIYLYDDPYIKIHGIEELNLTEAFVNMFASIVNCYMVCIENNDINNISKYILIELIHSIIHCVKLSKISGYPLTILLNKDSNINWYQDAYMYEYIIAKMFLFLNFKDMMNGEFGDIFLSLDTKYTILKSTISTNISTKISTNISTNISTKISTNISTKISTINKKYISYYSHYNTLVLNIASIYNNILSNKRTNIMVMQYHAIDCMIINKK